MRFTKMTVEQCQMLPAVLEGKDILVRSNTGTGKTISFLIPCIERASMFLMTPRSTQMSALIISPTRELASQIGDMAQQLLFFNDQITIDIFMGGKNINSEVARCNNTYPTILIVTPGRMLDHLERDVGELKLQLASLNTLVLDESDQLLAAGFLPSIETILSHVPMKSQDLQSMMFSATVPPSLHGVVSSTLKNDGYFLDADKTKTKWGLSQFNDEANTLLSKSSKSTDATTENIGVAMRRAAKIASEDLKAEKKRNGEGDPGTPTVSQATLTNFKDIVGPSIVQYHVICELEYQAIMLKRILGLATARKNYKVIVFFQTARATAYFVSIMYEMHNVDVLEMHSRKSQPHRAHVSHKFKSESNQVLFTSDVSARGVDYPNVTCCIQVGLPQNLENYIHRCGRSGRGVQGGLSIVLLSTFEQVFLKELGEQRIEVPRLDINFGENEHIANKLKPSSEFVQSKELLNRAKLHYQAWIGYYCSHIRRLKLDKVDIVQLSLKYSAGVLLLKEIPSIRASTAEKMGVKGIPGINIEMPVEGDRKETKQARKTNSYANDDVNNDNHDDRDNINNHDNTTNNT
jgi:ATP-dependent RNA helicase MSS116